MVWVIIGIVAFAFLMLICAAATKVEASKQKIENKELLKKIQKEKSHDDLQNSEDYEDIID